MKKNLFHLIAVAAFLSLIACEENSDKGEYEYSLVKTGERLIFELDSVSKRSNLFATYSEVLKSYCFYNDLNHSIYFYNIENGENWGVYPLQKEGPDAITGVRAIRPISKDSVLVFSSNSKDISLINSKGHVVRRFDFLKNRDTNGIVVFQPQLFLDGNKVYTMLRPTANSSRDFEGSVVKYDLKTGKIDFLMPYPLDNYDNGSWGGAQRQTYMIFNPIKKSLIMSYPWDNNLHTYNLSNDEVNSYYGGSDEMTSPEPLKAGASSQEVGEYLLSNCWYGTIFYDKYRKVYLRGGAIGKDLSTLSSDRILNINGDDYFKTTIILDEEFNKIGEVPNLGVSMATFATEDAYYFYDGDYQKDNEDIMAFSKYVLKKND